MQPQMKVGGTLNEETDEKMQVITATECFGQKKEKIIKLEFAILYGRKQFHSGRGKDVV